jgi:ABC-type amino acid transport system permease subunit
VSTEALPASSPPRPPRRFRVPLNLSGILFLIALVGLWQLAMSAGLLTSTFLPQPQEIGSSIVELTESGEMTSNLWHTVYVTLIGWALAGLIGLVLGLVIGLSMEAWRYSMASLEFFRALPGILRLLRSGQGGHLDLDLHVGKYEVLNHQDGGVAPVLLQLRRALGQPTLACLHIGFVVLSVAQVLVDAHDFGQFGSGFQQSRFGAVEGDIGLTCDVQDLGSVLSEKTGCSG